MFPEPPRVAWRLPAFPAGSQPPRCHPAVRQHGGHISTELRINDRIRVPEVRLVGPNGETVGIVPTGEALKLAAVCSLTMPAQHDPVVCGDHVIDSDRHAVRELRPRIERELDIAPVRWRLDALGDKPVEREGLVVGAREVAFFPPVSGG